ncbi:MAG TPA: hypothetical protein VL334_10695 [Anaerolineae bacterium]|nr:hypothetical protein [Anaerolineae bacterium]
MAGICLLWQKNASTAVEAFALCAPKGFEPVQVFVVRPDGSSPSAPAALSGTNWTAQFVFDQVGDYQALVVATLIPSQAPGGTGGFVYTWEEYADLTPGVFYFYWLEDMGTSGAATRHGSVSVTYITPTAVTLSAVEASAVAGNSTLPLASALLALLMLLASVPVLRRRRLDHERTNAARLLDKHRSAVYHSAPLALKDGASDLD